MVDFVNKLELSDQKYQTNGKIKDQNHNENFLFIMKDFVLFDTYHQSRYYMSTIFLKDKINGFCVPQFQLACIRDTTYSSHKIWLSCVVKYNICGG